MPHANRIWIALASAIVLASAVGTASARNLSISNQNFRVTWGPLTFGNISATISCHVTLEGSFHARTIAKILKNLIGYVTKATVNQGSCRAPLGFSASAAAWNGTETILGRTVGQSLPWHLTYEGFVGALPNISRLEALIRGLHFTVSIPLAGCLGHYGGPTLNNLGRIEVSSGTLTRWFPGIEDLPLIEGMGCESVIELGNSGQVSLLGNTSRITVTLI